MKKIISLFLLALCAVFLVGCKDSGNSDGVLIKKDKLIVSTNAAFPPFEFTDTDGKPVGVDMELAAEIGKILGLEVVIKDMEFDAVLSAVSSGTADIAMAGLTISEEREKNVDFCSEYFEASQVVVCKSNSAIAACATEADLLNALKNKNVGFQNGTVGQYYVEGDEDWGFDGIEGATAKGFTNGAAATLALNNGQIDCFIIDKAPATKFAATDSSLKAITTFPLTSENYAFAVNEGNTVLKLAINSALETLKSNGKFDQIIEKYFGGSSN